LLTKEYTENLKKDANSGFSHLTEKYKDAKSLSFILENLRYLPNKFDGSFLPVERFFEQLRSELEFCVLETFD